MTTVAKILNTFYNSFGVAAYNEMSVPDNAEYPYITYSLAESTMGYHARHYFQVWDHSSSNTLIITVADRIMQEIGQGKMFVHDKGSVCIRPDSGIQIMVDDSDYVEKIPQTPIRRAYVSLQLDTYNMPGT